jgi:hypothetical protein
LAFKIDDHGHKLERVHTDLQHITARVDHAHDRIDRGFR